MYNKHFDRHTPNLARAVAVEIPFNTYLFNQKRCGATSSFDLLHTVSSFTNEQSALRSPSQALRFLF